MLEFMITVLSFSFCVVERSPGNSSFFFFFFCFFFGFYL